MIVEIDSWEFHKDHDSFEADRQRDTVAARNGWLTFRTTWHRLTHKPIEEAESLDATLANRRALALVHRHATCAWQSRRAWETPGVRSPQTLSEADRRIVAAWAADCAERVLGLFESEAPGDRRPRDAIARARTFARGELDVAQEIRRRFAGNGAARQVSDPPAVAAAKAAGQAAAVAHMGAHALGAAAYAAKAAGLATPDRSDSVSEEVRWQLDNMSAAARAALRQLPPVGENPSGPLGPGLLASGLLGTIVRDLQAGISRPASPTEEPGDPGGDPRRSHPYLRSA